MLKKRIVVVLTGLALLAAVTGASLVADSFGLSTTSPAHACQAGGSSGGGC